MEGVDDRAPEASLHPEGMGVLGDVHQGVERPHDQHQNRQDDPGPGQWDADACQCQQYQPERRDLRRPQALDQRRREQTGRQCSHRHRRDGATQRRIAQIKAVLEFGQTRRGWRGARR